MPNLLSETSGLIAFVRTVESGSFSAAAKTLRTSPSVVSKGISRLEVVVGSRLFLRSTRSLSLTPEGHDLFEKVAPLLRQLDTSDDLQTDSRNVKGRVRFSMPSELAPALLTPIFREFAGSYPMVNLDVSLTDRRVDVVREDFDVVFRVGSVAGEHMRVRKLADLGMAIVASPDFVERYGQHLTPQQMAKVPFARYSVNGVAPSIYFSDGSHFDPGGRVDCDTGRALRAAALEGLGAAYVMRFAVRDDLGKGLVEIAPPGSLLPLPLNLIHAFGHQLPARVRHFCDFASETTRRLQPLLN